jgi:hypothetical protein
MSGKAKRNVRSDDNPLDAFKDTTNIKRQREILMQICQFIPPLNQTQAVSDICRLLSYSKKTFDTVKLQSMFDTLAEEYTKLQQAEAAQQLQLQQQQLQLKLQQQQQKPEVMKNPLPDSYELGNFGRLRARVLERKERFAKVKNTTRLVLKCCQLPHLTVLSGCDSLHDLLHARIGSLEHAEKTVHNHIDELSRSFLGITPTLRDYRFPNSLIQCLSSLPVTKPPDHVLSIADWIGNLEEGGRQSMGTVSWISAASNLERDAIKYILERKNLEVNLFPNIRPYFKTKTYDYAEFIEVPERDLMRAKEYFNHFKISDESGKLSGILKVSETKNKLGRNLLLLDVGNTGDYLVAMVNDGGHAGVKGKAFSGLHQVMHIMTQATVSDSSPQSPLFPRPTYYIAVGTPDGNGIKFLAVDPDNIPFCTDNSIMVWFETMDNMFTPKRQNFVIVVHDLKNNRRLKYNLDGIGQGPSVSDIMLFLFESLQPTHSSHKNPNSKSDLKLTSPPKHHLNMLNCKVFDTMRNPPTEITDINQDYIISLLHEGLALAFKGMGDTSQIDALYFLKKYDETFKRQFPYSIFTTCDRICAVDAYSKGIPTNLVYGTTIELFIPDTPPIHMTEEEIVQENIRRQHEIRMMNEAEELSDMLLLVNQIEGNDIQNLRDLIILLNTLVSTLNGKLVSQISIPQFGDPSIALAIAEVHAIFVRVYNCKEIMKKPDDIQHVFTNLEDLKTHADTPSERTGHIYTHCRPALEHLNRFNKSVQSLFSNKLLRSLSHNSIQAQLDNACRFDGWFTSRMSFTPFGFNGSMYSNLSAGLVKLRRVNQSTNDRFISIFIRDVQNLSLHQDIMYFIDRFSEFDSRTLPAALNNLIESLREIKSINNKDQIGPVIDKLSTNSGLLCQSIQHLHGVPITGTGTKHPHPSSKGGNLKHSSRRSGGKTVKSSRKHKYESMKGGAPLNDYQSEELHRIYHNLSFKICILLEKWVKDFDVEGDKEDTNELKLAKMVRERELIVQENPEIMDIFYQDFMAIVSEYANHLLDLELSPLYKDDTAAGYDYEHDTQTLNLIHRLFLYFENYTTPSELLDINSPSPISCLFIGVIPTGGVLNDDNIPREIIVGFLQLASLIKPYEHSLRSSFVKQHLLHDYLLDNTRQLFACKKIGDIWIDAVASDINRVGGVLSAAIVVGESMLRAPAPSVIDLRNEITRLLSKDRPGFKKLISFINFYINNNPEFKVIDDNLKILKINEVVALIRERNIIGYSELQTLLLTELLSLDEQGDSVRSVNTEASADIIAVNTTIIPYLYCYYSSRDNITTWDELRSCYSLISASIPSESPESPESPHSVGIPTPANLRVAGATTTTAQSRPDTFDPRFLFPRHGSPPPRPDGGQPANVGDGDPMDGSAGGGGGGGGWDHRNWGGSSSRRRHNFRKNSRSKHNNKKRSHKKNKNINTKKYRKLHSKMKYTIKRRKSRRNNSDS